MLDAGVSPTVQESHDPHYTPLLTAAEAGQREIARLLWQLVGPDGRSYPKERTCLWVAAYRGHADLVADFLDIWDGWPIEEKCAALCGAARQWHHDVVGLLLARVTFEADALQDALEESIDRGPILLVALWGSRVPITTAEDDLRLQRVTGTLEQLQLCLTSCRDADAAIRLHTLNNKSLLHYAATGGKQDNAEFLLSRGLDVDAVDTNR
ncbi:hypothetical protein VTG60DRAFT_1126 [Thermothelomyces hinnuleus]